MTKATSCSTTAVGTICGTSINFLTGVCETQTLSFFQRRDEDKVALFRRKVQETVTDAVDIVKDLAAKATSEKMDVWGDVARIGTFAIMAFGAIKAVNGGRGSGHREEMPDVRTMTVNNYYYGVRPQQFGRKKKNV